MLHRGPDEQHSFALDNIDLYHFRLSILDVSGGKQPMHLHDRYSIVFNGEIYNHAEIRTQHGLQGQTASDTETLLLLYEKFGAHALHFLDGMFAFAIYDRKEKKIFIARDRAGKKPVYYYLKNNQFVFASELNALKGMLPLEKNDTHLCQYLRLGSFYGSSTPYNDVHELQAGSYLTIDCSLLSVVEKKWWDIHRWYEKKHPDDFDTALEKVDSFLHKGIQRRVESSDLEVGSFLSGGIDSGLVTAIAKQYNQQLKTFTVSFKGEYDEAPLAKLVADRYQTNHTEINISFDQLQSDVETILCNYG
jgi:asparagine synthase (glutamine-hydrolysing)